MYSSYQTRHKAFRAEVCRFCIERCIPNLQCFQYCEISVCTVVALNCKPFQSVQIFCMFLFFSTVQTNPAECRHYRKLSPQCCSEAPSLMKPSDCLVMNRKRLGPMLAMYSAVRGAVKQMQLPLCAIIICPLL